MRLPARTMQVIPPSDAKVFQDYVLPSLSLLPNDPEESVRVEYAAGVPFLSLYVHDYAPHRHSQTKTCNCTCTFAHALQRTLHTQAVLSSACLEMLGGG